MKRHLMAAMTLLAWTVAAIAADGGVAAYEQGKEYGPISILGNETVTIDGHGAIIDGGEKVRCATLGPNVTLKNFTFRNGRASVGGGVWGGKVVDCTITNCTATEYGAAVAKCAVSGTTIADCKRPLNSSGVAMHGGIAADSTLDGVTISGCRVEMGVNAPCFGGIAANSSLVDCKVTDNTLVISGDHYGLLFYGGSLSRSTITGNSVDSAVANVAAYMKATPVDCTLDVSTPPPGPVTPDPPPGGDDPPPGGDDPPPDFGGYTPEEDIELAPGEGLVNWYLAPVYLDQLGNFSRSYDRWTNVKAEGLPKGLTLVKTKVGDMYVYQIEGVPTEPLDGVTRIAYVRITDAQKRVTLRPLKYLRIYQAPVAVFPPATNKVEYWRFPVSKIWPGYTDDTKQNWTFSGWPSGIKFASRNTFYNQRNVAAGYVYGKPTKVGTFTVKAVEKIAGTRYKNTHLATFIVRYEDGQKPNSTDKPVPAAAVQLPTDMRETVETVRDLRVGVAYLWTLTNTPYSTVTASGLPAGLKLASSNVLDRITRKKTYFYRVTGVPTKPGYYLAKFTAKLNGVSSVSTIAFNVEELPPWAHGTFDGGVGVFETSPGGQVTLTVSKVGKLSGKWMSAGTNWTLSAASFARYDRSDGCYYATVTRKTGSGKKAVVLAEEVRIAADAAGGVASSELFLAYQNNWKLEPWKTLGKTIAKAAAFEFKPYADAGDDHTNDVISLKFAASGKVTVKASYFKSVSKTGKISWTTASGSAVLCPQDLPDEYGAFPAVVFVYLPPKKGTPTEGTAYAVCVRLRWDGEKFVEELVLE